MALPKNIPVLLYSQNRKFIVNLTGDFEILEDFGVIDTSRILSLNYGEKITLWDETFYVLEPNIDDIVECIKRRAQIIRPKDSAIIITRSNIRCGSIVVEGGGGSGALTIALLRAVYPSGKVITYELREEFAKILSKNIETMNLSSNWVLRIADVRKDVIETNVDAFVLDIPDPWNAVEMARKSLRNGGTFCAYVPTYNQLEKTVWELRKNDFIDVRSFEIIEREIVVHDLGTRPSNEYIGHTAFLVFGRKTI